MQISTHIQFLKGVGPKKAEKFCKLGIVTIKDLLNYYPRDYIDYSNPLPINQAPLDTPCTIRGVVIKILPPVRLAGNKTIQKIYCDSDNMPFTIVFFNNLYAVKKLQVDNSYIFYGKLSHKMSAFEMISPVFIPADAPKPITAIYPLTAGLSNYAIANCVASALPMADEIEEFLPTLLMQKYGLISKKESIIKIHKPASLQDVEQAKKRLVFEELFLLQLGLLQMKHKEVVTTGAIMQTQSIKLFLDAIPFQLTDAQKRAIDEILLDMQHSFPMNRLLQGDVGSGKTLVAAAVIYFAYKNGYQSVLMAPTEILAVQHAKTLEQWLAPLGLSIGLLTGNVKGKARTQLLDAIKAGKANVVVGTHAVISEGVVYKNLGLTITDEQHRFGVRQRGLLADKGNHPHMLVMSATPIPRTLALLMFGDLDISVLDELPPGRKRIKTYAITGAKRLDMFGFLRAQIDEGQQVYIVCPLIEEGESDLKAAKVYIEEIVKPLLPNKRIGLMHGKLKGIEKENMMNAFINHELDVLVSTTVIEVGVDVPNATVMVIEDAERYGLSALHQLRGRVGRGSKESHCILVTEHASQKARERLQFLCQHADGFEVSEYDLQTRGPGEFFGSKQHGVPALKVANLSTDLLLLQAAQEEAQALLKTDPLLESDENRILKKQVQTLFKKSIILN